MTPNERTGGMWGLLDKIKAGWKAVGIFKAIYSLVGFFLIGVAPSALTTSYTLEAFIYTFSVLGGILGVFRTAAVWKGAGKDQRKRRSDLYLWLALVSFFVGIALVSLLDPQIAGKNALFDAIYDSLVDFMLFANVAIGLAFGFAAFFLAGIFTILSPAMDRQFTAKTQTDGPRRSSGAKKAKSREAEPPN